MILAQLTGPIPFALLVVGLGFIIFVHELGHFLVAKMVGIKVDQFAIGFGHALVSWRKGIGFRPGSTEPEMRKRLAGGARETDFGETEYRLNWMPLGGYVKMLGQDDMDPAKLSDNPRAYNRKSISARVAVISAGVIMNVIFGAIFFIVAFYPFHDQWGVQAPPAVVGGVVPDSPAATTPAENDPDAIGLRPGDRIVGLKGGDRPSDFSEVRINTALSHPDYPIELHIERPAFGDQPARELMFNIKTISDPQLDLPYLGISPPSKLQLPDLPKNKEAAESTGAAIKAIDEDLEPGMTLTAVNGRPVEHHWQYLLMLREAEGRQVTVTFTGDAGATTEVRLEPSSQLQVAEQPAPWMDAEPKTEPVPHLAGLVPPVRLSPIPDRPAAGKVQAGDLVVSVNGQRWPTMQRFVHVVAHATGDVDLVLLRDGERVEVTITPERSWWPWASPKIGVGLGWATDTTVIARALPDSPAARLDLLAGTQVKAIGGQAVSDYSDMRRALAGRDGDAVELAVALPVAGGVDESATLTLDEKTAAGLAQLRWGDPIGLFEPLRVLQQADSVGGAIAIGLDKTWLFMKQVYVTLARLAQGSVKASHLSGPVGIVHGGSRFASEGVPYLLYFLGLLSVNLAVINFLPLPIVDGGHFVLLMIEKLRGKPVPVKVQSAITWVGLILLGTLVIFLTFNDIQRIAGG